MFHLNVMFHLSALNEEGLEAFRSFVGQRIRLKIDELNDNYLVSEVGKKFLVNIWAGFPKS